GVAGQVGQGGAQAGACGFLVEQGADAGGIVGADVRVGQGAGDGPGVVPDARRQGAEPAGGRGAPAQGEGAREGGPGAAGGASGGASGRGSCPVVAADGEQQVYEGQAGRRTATQPEPTIPGRRQAQYPRCDRPWEAKNRDRGGSVLVASPQESPCSGREDGRR